MLERDLQDAVIESMRLQGWLVAHFRPARTAHGWATPVSADGKGFPDVVAARERVIFVEFKVPPNKLRPDQEKWLQRLRAAGAECYVWYPDNWLSGEIDKVLAPAYLSNIDPGDETDAKT